MTYVEEILCSFTDKWDSFSDYVGTNIGVQKLDLEHHYCNMEVNMVCWNLGSNTQMSHSDAL